MKLGPVHVTWMTSKRQRTLAMEIREHLTTDAGSRGVVAKMARSEVKNYLAELAEEAGKPFGDPGAFLAMVRDEVSRCQELVFHGPGCPGHTTGLPAECCMEKSDAPSSE